MNLKTAQKRYKVTWEDGYNGGDDPWRYMEIKGKYGQIHPYSETHLIVLINASRVAQRIKRGGKWPLVRDSDDGAEFKAENKDLTALCGVIGASKKRHGNPEAAERLKKYRFKKKG